MNKKIVNNKLLFVSYEAVGLFLNIYVKVAFTLLVIK